MSERPWSASGQAVAASGSAGDYTGNYTSLLLSLTVSTVASTGIVRDSAADGQAIYGRYADQTLINHGRISASGSDGLGVELRFGSSALENTGSISGAGGGVVLGSAGTIDNAGYIGGALGAVYAGNASALNNSGTIESLANSAGQAVYLLSGSVANTAGGTIIGAAAGVVTHGAVSNGATIEATGTDADAVVASALVNTGRIDAAGSHGLGVYLFGAGIAGGEGLLTNAAGGTILADGLDGGGIFVARGGSVTNGGTVQANAYGGFAIIGDAVGVLVDNQAGGLVEGYAAGVALGDGTVENAGTIDAGGTRGAGIEVSGYSYSLGMVENAAGGLISGGLDGVYLTGGTVVNDGIIEGGAYGVAVDQGNVVNTGTIAGFAGTGFGFGVDGIGTVDNAGLIVGGEYGVTLYHGVVFNSGVIDGNVGVIIDQGTVADAGLIASRYGGYGDAVVLQSAYTVLKLLPGAAIEGIVLGAGGTLLLGAGDGAVGRLSGLGSQFLEFGAIEIRASADWTLAGGNSFDGTLLVDGTLVDAGRLTIGPDGVLDNEGVVAVRGTLVDQSAGLEIGTVEIGRGGTLDLAGTLSAGQFVLGVVTFEAPAGLLEIGPGETFAGSIGALRLGDTIDLAGIGFVAGAETASYQDGRLVLTGAGETLASFAAFGIPAGAGFAATADGHGGTEIVARPFGLTSLVDGMTSAQAQAFAAGFAALARDVAATQGVANPGVDVFTPAVLGVPGGGTAFDTIPVPGYVDVANGAPTVAGQSVTLGLHTQALVLAGSTAASLLGHAANQYAATEMLVGNAGNDTIRGAGGAGTILSGSGANQIHTGPGSMLVSSGGSDLIDTGTGNDTVDAYGAATVFAGAGTTTFADLGTASGADKVRAGSGTTVMRSGLGSDTFIGGSGSSQMIDSGPGHVAFQFNQGAGGNDVVTGFDAAAGDYVRVTAESFGARAILGHATVEGGSTYVKLGDGTRIQFVGVTDLTAADFHG